MKLAALLLALVAIAAPLRSQNQDATFVNGIDGYILVPANPSLTPPAAITVEAWVYFNAAGLSTTNLYPTIVRKNIANGQEEYFLRVEGTGSLRWKIKISAATSLIVDSPSAMPSGIWTHVAGTYDGVTARLYMNGALVGQTAGAPGTPFNGGAALRIGKGDDQTSPSEVWSGKIDEVRIWSVARTAAQIQSTMNVEAVAVPNLVSAWRMSGGGADSIGPNTGTIVGSVGFALSALALLGGPAPWQVNQPPAISVDIDGISSDGYLPGSVVRTFSPCGPATATLNVAMNPANPWNLAITLTQGVSGASGLTTPGGQTINVNTTHPSFSFLFPGGFGPPTPALSVPISFNSSFIAAVQGVVLNPASADGFSLSSMVELRTVPGPSSIPGPTGDDSVLTVMLSNPALCGAPAIMPFFNANYTQFDVSSNGRVLFGSPVPNTSGNATVAAALSSDPFVGAWCDLAPNQGGRIFVSVPASGIVRVDWSQVQYKNAAGSATFGIVLDGNTGTIMLDRLGGIQVSMILQFLGISAGNLGPATNAGQTGFAVGGPFFPGTSFDMLYVFGAAGNLTPGLTAIVFYPTATTFGYAWSAY